MFRIQEKAAIGSQVHRYVVEAPDISRKAKAGQFVILRIDERGERIPITIADMDKSAGTITLCVQVVGKTTLQMSLLRTGDSLLDVVGPLGQPSIIERVGTVVCVGGGFGTAVLYPILREHHLAENKTIALLGARTVRLLILEAEVRSVSDELRIATEDGSAGTRGLVTPILAELLLGSEQIDQVIAVGPLAMMQAVSELTRPRGIKTTVSLNPLMMDGTGMCGACRVTVGGQIRFACVDGPEFDGHLVNFDELINRSRMYRAEEGLSLERYRKQVEEECKVGG